MPKQTLKITEFFGGLNNASNPSNIQDNELSSAIGCSVSSMGTITMEGSAFGDETDTQYSTLTCDGYDGGEPCGLAYAGALTYIHSDWKWNLISFTNSASAHGFSVGDYIGNGADFTADDVNVGKVVSKITNTFTLANFKVTGTAWTDSDTMYEGTSLQDEAATSSGWQPGGSAGDMQTPVNEGGGEGYCIALDAHQGLWVKPDSEDIWVRVHEDLLNADQSSTAIGFSTYYTNGILRVSDMDFSDENNKSWWWGYISQELFQGSAGSPRHEIGMFHGGVQDTADAIDSIDFVLDTSLISMPDASVVSTDRISLLYTAWTEPKVYGEWTGTYSFAIALNYLSGATGKLKINDGPIAMLNSHFSYIFAIDQETVGVSTPTGPNGNSYLNDHRVSGCTIYFKERFDDAWHILNEIDFQTGNDSFWGIYSTDDTAVGIFNADLDPVFLSEVDNNNAEYAYVTGSITYGDIIEQTHDLEMTWYVVVTGLHNSPAYYAWLIEDGRRTCSITNYNPAQGDHTISAHVVDENMCLVKPADDFEYTVTDYGNFVAPPPIVQNWGPCWVAVALWGWQDPRTQQTKHYVINNNNIFTRLYKRYGEYWASILEKWKLLKLFAYPWWFYMSKKGLKYYNKQLGYPNLTKTIKGLHNKYPGQFKYYLIGSNMRNENITHYYDTQIAPQTDDMDFDIWEDVLKTLYYVREEDERYANPSICPNFEKIREYDDNGVFEHRNDLTDCYFYYDSKHPKDFNIENIKKDGHVEHLQGNLWLNIHELIGEKWRNKGLDKCKYFNKEIK